MREEHWLSFLRAACAAAVVYLPGSRLQRPGFLIPRLTAPVASSVRPSASAPALLDDLGQDATSLVSGQGVMVEYLPGARVAQMKGPRGSTILLTLVWGGSKSPWSHLQGGGRGACF